MNMDKEPALLIAGLTALVAAVCGLLVAFGLNVTKEQQDAIVGAVVAVVTVVPLVAGFIRHYVFAPDTVNRVRADHYMSGYADGQAEATK